jgi:hypothetical protein
MSSLPPLPTAQTFRADVPATPSRLLPGLKDGSLAGLHLRPSQCKISAPEPVDPTAQTSSAEIAATPAKPPKAPTPGTGTCFQAVPFQAISAGFWLGA